MIRGRVGSLLEVGTGFHPELTGRENIFLNGSVLGMTSQGDPGEARRHRRVLRCFEVPRHTCQAVLERHVRPPCLLRGRALRAGGAARGRGARRRRRRVPASLSRQDGGPQPRGADGAVRLAQHAGAGTALRPRRPARPRRGGPRRSERRARRLLPPGGDGHGVATRVAGSRDRSRRQVRDGYAKRGSSTRTAVRPALQTSAGPSDRADVDGAP